MASQAHAASGAEVAARPAADRRSRSARRRRSHPPTRESRPRVDALPLATSPAWTPDVGPTPRSEVAPAAIVEPINHGPPRGVILYVSTNSPTASLQEASVAVPRVPSEIALVERARDGDHDAFAALLDARLQLHLPHRAGHPRRRVGRPGRHAGHLRPGVERTFRSFATRPCFRPGSGGSWSTRPGPRCAAVDDEQSGRSRSSCPVRRGGLAHRRRGPGQEDRAAALDRLERALGRLAPAERTVLWLHHYEGLSLTDVGTRLGVPPKTVKSRLFTARRALERALLAEDR